MQRSFSDDIHLSAEQIFEVLLQGHVVHEAPSLFHVDEDVEITVRLVLLTSSRTKKPQVPRPVLLG